MSLVSKESAFQGRGPGEGVLRVGGKTGEVAGCAQVALLCPRRQHERLLFSLWVGACRSSAMGDGSFCHCCRQRTEQESPRDGPPPRSPARLACACTEMRLFSLEDGEGEGGGPSETAEDPRLDLHTDQQAGFAASTGVLGGSCDMCQSPPVRSAFLSLFVSCSFIQT